MSFASDIANIVSNGSYTSAQKKDLIYALKTGAIRDNAISIINQSWANSIYEITITSVAVDTKNRLIVWCTAKKNGLSLKLNLPFIYINPPIVYSGNEDPSEALKQMVLDTVKRF